jgi:hypothetical protein
MVVGGNVLNLPSKMDDLAAKINHIRAVRRGDIDKPIPEIAAHVEKAIGNRRGVPSVRCLFLVPKW